jgi:hypothetical protein
VSTKEHLSKHDRQIAKILEIMGRFARGMMQLQAAQKRTDAALRGLIERGNVH